MFPPSDLTVLQPHAARQAHHATQENGLEQNPPDVCARYKSLYCRRSQTRTGQKPILRKSIREALLAQRQPVLFFSNRIMSDLVCNKVGNVHTNRPAVTGAGADGLAGGSGAGGVGSGTFTTPLAASAGVGKPLGACNQQQQSVS